MPRTVAILGRPNVGKSTLFNRLTGGRRQAIVDDTPGVTRDRLEGKGSLAGLVFRVIDTAGLEADPADDLQARLRRQTLAGLAEADVGLFLIDARLGVTPADADVANLLRRQDKPILLLANKSEGGAALAQGQEAWGLGLGPPIPVSAKEAQGFADLVEALVPLLREPEAEDDVAPDDGAEAGAEEPERPLRLAIVGRPNVGKSSLVNRLLDQERVLTGPEPGLTRDSVRIAWEWRGRRIQLVDTAGLRRKAKVEQRLEKMSTGSTIDALKFAEVVVLVTDGTQPLERQDLTIARLILQEGRALVVAVNKWDLIEDQQAVRAEIRRSLDHQLVDAKGVVPVTLSARTGRDVDKLLPAVVDAHRRWSARVSTGALNRGLQEALARHTPPLVGGRRIKIRYGTQASARPPTFVLFANKPAEEMPESYLRYLTNSLRESFDLAGVPIRVHVRQPMNPYADGDD
jgi:GTP-binding protein